MRNWFWLRSSHPFSLLTILQPTFSSTSQQFSCVSRLLHPRYLWLLILNAKPCCWCTRLPKEPLPWTGLLPPGHAPPHHALRYDRPLSSPFPAATWSLLHFQLFSLLALQHWNDLPTPVQNSRGTSCSSAIGLKMHLFEKYFTFSTTSRSYHISLP